MATIKCSTPGAKILHALLNKKDPVSDRILTPLQEIIFREGREMLAHGTSIEAVERWTRKEVAEVGV